MPAFQASEYSYGATTASGGNALEQLTGLLSSAAPAISVASELLGKTDREKVAILTARVKNYKRLMNTPPYSFVPGAAWYKSEITKMKAQISALGASVQADDDATQDYSIMRKLTSAGGLVGVGVGCAVIYFIYKRANK
ncbi:MAG: hypothetical protein Q8P18_33225 [Pseudomonadota bacterium]|nr:hypothetical protein [Pseudomonadota bacterium]